MLLLSRSSSSSAQPKQQPVIKFENETVFMIENCVRRMKELQASELKEKMLRLSIEAGGCSGFQYEFTLDDKENGDDRRIRPGQTQSMEIGGQGLGRSAATFRRREGGNMGGWLLVIMFFSSAFQTSSSVTHSYCALSGLASDSAALKSSL